MQLDKPPLFDAIDAVKDILEIFMALFGNIVIEKEAIAAKVKDMVKAKDAKGKDRAPSYLSASSIKGRNLFTDL